MRTERAAGVVAGYAADRLLGDPRRWHPVAGFGAVAACFERTLWRDSRWAGTAYAAVLVGGSALAARAFDRRGGGGGPRERDRRGALPWAGEEPRRGSARRCAWLAAVTWVALGGRSLEREAAGLAGLVAAGDLEAARARLPALAGREPAGLCAEELCRAAVESVAENTADAVVAPLLWGAVAGPAGVAAHRAANTLDAMVGHRGARYERFGWAGARLDDALGWPAARLGALLAVVLAPLVGGEARAACETLLRDGAAHPSPNAGRLEAAFAGALGVRLGGTNRYPSRVEHRPHLGAGRAPAPADVHRAALLSRAVGAASAALLGVCAAATRASADLAVPWTPDATLDARARR